MTKGKFRPMLFLVIVWLHVMAVYAMWYGYHNGVSREVWWHLLIRYTVGAVGISLGFHRLFTHRSFKCHFATEVLLAFCGGTAVQGSISGWVMDHAQHHSDTEGPWDPHTPNKYPGLLGFLWAHMGWLFWEVNRPSESFVNTTARMNMRIVRWDKFINPLAILSGFVVPYYFDGMTGLLVEGFLGAVLILHITWCVNSVCHMFGGVDPIFRVTGDKSKNNWPMATLTYIGEAWHNYHHQKADVAFLAWRWYQPDLGKWILVAGEPLGLFWEIKRPPTRAQA